MSTKYVRELLESVDPLNPVRVHERIGEALQELRAVEAARAKDAELIQRLVDALYGLQFDEGNIIPAYHNADRAIEAAAAAGYKPSEP